MPRRAAKTHVEVTGLVELNAKLAALPAVVRGGSRVAVKDETHELAEDMRNTAPVLTGQLRAGIRERIARGGMEGRAVSTARHTTFVVFGTSDTPVQDFMTPAAERSRLRFPGRAARAIDAELGKL